jgi:sigma-B regulation protein RsbU (phosphoserine phosphatase)
MDPHLFVERLTFQLSSIQEGFHILAKSKSVMELAKQYSHFLRGNFFTANVNIFLRKKNAYEWLPLSLHKKDSEQYKSLLSVKDQIHINYVENGPYRIVVTIPLIDQSALGLLIGEKLNKQPYDDFDKILIPIFIQLLDGSYQSLNHRQKEKELIFSLNQRVLQLNSLIDAGIEISRFTQQTSLRQLALERIVALTNASKGIFFITEKRRLKEKLFFPAKFKAQSLQKTGYFISAEFNFLDQRYTFQLFQKESRTGIVHFDKTDQLLLDAVARQVNVAIENHYLLQETLEKQKIEQDISVAASIQKKILPEKLPEIPGYDLSGINIPTKYVGGDYYDCIALKNGKYALIIADVSGKGVSAALLVSSLQAFLTAYLDSELSLPDLANKLNKVIYNASTDDKYITFYLAILSPETGEIHSLNAGHNTIYHLTNNKSVKELKVGGVPLGMLGLEIAYEFETLKLNLGDRLLLYTDGVTEAMNEKEEEYEDIHPLKEFFKNHTTHSAQTFIYDLIDDIKNFTGNTPQSDDITVLCIIRKKK